jgi:hypothetical protein
MVIATALLLVVGMVAFAGYRYLHANRWVIVQQNPRWIQLDDSDRSDLKKVEPGENSNEISYNEISFFPYPQIILKEGRAKFLPQDRGGNKFLLGYKLVVGLEAHKPESDMSRYDPYEYGLRFVFTLVDKDGFHLAVIEAPKALSTFRVPETKALQEVCRIPIAEGIADRTHMVYVDYVVSVTPKKKLQLLR